jgi:hypothetical protein
MIGRFLLLQIKSFTVLNMKKNLKADLKGFEPVLVTDTVIADAYRETENF